MLVSLMTKTKLKDILEAAMISTPGGFTNNSPISPVTSTPIKKPSARKSMCLFTNILYAKNKTANCRVGAAKYKRKAIISGTTPWVLEPKQKLNSKINDHINKSHYNWIMHHPQVVQSKILNYCLNVNIDGHTGPQIVPKMLLQVSVQEFIAPSLVTQYMVDSERQEMQ